MWFSKKKLTPSSTSASTSFTNVRDTYFSIKKKNARFSTVYIILASIFVGVLGLGLMMRFSNFEVSLPIPTFITDYIPFVKSEAGPDKINILLTGVGGGGHEGPELTDTVILASVQYRTNSVTLLSLPRDLFVEIGSRWVRGKINEVYQRSLRNSTPAEAMQQLAQKVTEITGERVDGYLKINFTGFTKTVDTLGGIDIDVPDDIVDREYPDNNWGYQTFRIKKWLQTLDGATALKYARSRHSTSDFDRSTRQQLVVRAIKEKLFSLDALGSPTKLQSLYDGVKTHIDTSLSFSEILKITYFAKTLDSANILSFNLNDRCFQGAGYCDTGGFLYTPERDGFGGMAVLLPDTASAINISEYSSIQKFSRLIYGYPGIALEKEEVVIVNATKYPGIANKLALRLKKYGFNVPEKWSITSTKDLVTASSIEYIWDDVTKIGISPDSQTLTGLSLLFNAPRSPTRDLPYTKLVGPRIEIILWPDALDLLKE